MLEEKEGASEEKAHQIVEQIWKIINDTANYMFCAAHAFSMACDSLYAAWLKVHYPYELYVTMLKLYDEKKNTDKISAIIAEMKRYKNINLTAGRFGQDNRDWFVDKEHGTISQSLSSIRYMSKQASKDLYKLGQCEYVSMSPEPVSLEDKLFQAMLKRDTENGELSKEEAEKIKHEEYHYVKLDCFTNVLRALQMHTCLDTRQIEIFIELNYFEQFGKSGKLMKVYNEFFEGKNKLTKTVKSYESRLNSCREYEKSLPDEELNIGQRLSSEFYNVGLCLSSDRTKPNNLYFVQEVDTKYGVKCKLYSVQRGTTGIVRVRKNDYNKYSFNEGDCLMLIKFNTSPRYTYKGGSRTELPGEKDIWAAQYEVIKAPG